MADRNLVLQCEKGTFVDQNDNKRQIEYTTFYVELAGLRIKLKPVDQTAKQLLENFYK